MYYQLNTDNLRMNINRHNYEEFFILYLDNELSSEDRRMVEAFIQHHPDLNEELELLMQYKLVPDESIVFDNKETLVKGDAVINIANYEEWFLLYIDNELSISQKLFVEEFITENPYAKKEFQILQQSKLQPETVVFANKESLYRKEEKVRFMPLRWQRVAAILIFALGLTTFLVLNSKKTVEDGPIAITPGTEQSSPVLIPTKQLPKENIVAEIKVKEEPHIVVPEEKSPSLKPQDANKNIATNNTPTSPIIKLPVNKYPVQSNKEEVSLIANNNTPNNNLPLPDKNPNVIKDDVINNTIANIDVPKENKKVEALTNPVVTTKSPQPSDYTNASFIEEESQQDGKKNKLRGFFRKITRTFEKRTNIDPTNDDGKLLVAGLAIKLK